MALATTPAAGTFRNAETGKIFDYRKIQDDEFNPFGMPFEIFVGYDEKRYALIHKTVAYIVIDEDADGRAVLEKWAIRGHRKIQSYDY